MGGNQTGRVVEESGYYQVLCCSCGRRMMSVVISVCENEAHDSSKVKALFDVGSDVEKMKNECMTSKSRVDAGPSLRNPSLLKLYGMPILL
jgi:hypothetical protein